VAYIYVNVCVYIYTRIHRYFGNVAVCIYMFVCMYLYVYTHRYVSWKGRHIGNVAGVYSYRDMFVCTYTHTNIHTCIYTYIHMYIYTYINIHKFALEEREAHRKSGGYIYVYIYE